MNPLLFPIIILLLKLIIPLLIQYIKIQSKIFMENSYKKNEEYAKKEYLKSIKNNPNGFAFVYGGKNPRCPYAPSQLNLCAISKYIYEKEDMVDIDPQLSEGFEDEIFSCLLHYKYPENEFLFPTSIKCAHFKNPNINMYGGEVESTWCTNKSLIDWNNLSKNSSEIIDYIKKYKDLPDLKKYKNNKQSLNKKSNSLNYWFDLFN